MRRRSGERVVALRSLDDVDVMRRCCATTTSASADARMMILGFVMPSTKSAPVCRAFSKRKGLVRVGDEELDVAVEPRAAAIRKSVLAVLCLRVVERELARDRGEPAHDHERQQAGAAPNSLSRLGRRRVLDDLGRERERAVVVVVEIEDPGLLGPVGVRRRHDLPEASAAGARLA